RAAQSALALTGAQLHDADAASVAGLACAQRQVVVVGSPVAAPAGRTLVVVRVARRPFAGLRQLRGHQPAQDGYATLDLQLVEGGKVEANERLVGRLQEERR